MYEMSHLIFFVVFLRK